jgi:glutamate receptor, ionotropic, invertebrate
MSDLLKMYDRKGYTVTVRQLELNVNNNYRPILAHVKESEDLNIILHCSIELLPEILKQAQQVGLMTGQHQIFITSLDMHTIDMEPFQYSGTNITGVRLIDPEDPMVIQVTDFFNTSERSKGIDMAEGLTPEKLRVETALMFDGVLLLAEALKDLDGFTQLQTISLKCNDSATWKNGYSIVNYMKTVILVGNTSGHFQLVLLCFIECHLRVDETHQI